MFGQPVQWRHITILARTYSKYAIRGGSGLVYLLVFLLVGLFVGGFIVDPLKKLHESVQKEMAKQGKKLETEEFMKQVVNEVRPAIAWWVGAQEERPAERFEVVNGKVKEKDFKKDPLVQHLVIERPPILSAFLLILMAFVPFTVCLGSFNQLSGDIGSKGLRYLLLRTERINIILARLLGTVLFTSVTTLFMMFVVIFYMYMAFRTDNLGDLLLWGLWGWVAILILSLPYICLCTWMSTIFDMPFATLVLCYLLVGFPIAFIKILKGMVLQGDREYDWLDRLTPFGWKYDLLHPDFGVAALAIGIMLVTAVFFFLLAVWHFLRRDL